MSQLGSHGHQRRAVDDRLPRRCTRPAAATGAQSRPRARRRRRDESQPRQHAQLHRSARGRGIPRTNASSAAASVSYPISRGRDGLPADSPRETGPRAPLPHVPHARRRVRSRRPVPRRPAPGHPPGRRPVRLRDRPRRAGAGRSERQALEGPITARCGDRHPDRSRPSGGHWAPGSRLPAPGRGPRPPRRRRGRGRRPDGRQQRGAGPPWTCSPTWVTAGSGTSTAATTRRRRATPRPPGRDAPAPPILGRARITGRLPRVGHQLRGAPQSTKSAICSIHLNMRSIQR